MSGSPKRRARRERTEALIADPHALDVICGEVASGRTLADYCRDPRPDRDEPIPEGTEVDVLFSRVNAWLQGDDDRRKRYDDALSVRERHNKDDVISELLKLIKVDVTEAFNEDGDLRPLADIPPDVRRAIAGIEVEALFAGKGDARTQIGHLKKVKFWDKPRSIETLARHLKMLVDKHEVAGKLTLADLLGDDQAKPK